VFKSDLLTYSCFTRTPTPAEGLRVLRGTSEVAPPNAPSSSDQPSPSAARRWDPSFVGGEGLDL